MEKERRRGRRSIIVHKADIFKLLSGKNTLMKRTKQYIKMISTADIEVFISLFIIFIFSGCYLERI